MIFNHGLNELYEFFFFGNQKWHLCGGWFDFSYS
jgi:hypothetical protein